MRASSENGHGPTVARTVVCTCRSTTGLLLPPSGSPQSTDTSVPGTLCASSTIDSEIHTLPFEV